MSTEAFKITHAGFTIEFDPRDRKFRVLDNDGGVLKETGDFETATKFAEGGAQKKEKKAKSFDRIPCFELEYDNGSPAMLEITSSTGISGWRGKEEVWTVRLEAKDWHKKGERQKKVLRVYMLCQIKTQKFLLK